MTDDTPLRLSFTLPPARLDAAANAIVGRAMGPWRRALVPVVPLTTGVLGAVGVCWLVGLPPGPALLAGLYAVIGAFAGFALIRRIVTRRNLNIQSTSAFRNLPLVLRLDERELVFESRALPWSAIAGTTRWQDYTLIQFSAADTLVVPDAALPPGMTPEMLETRIVGRIIAGGPR